MAIVFERLPCGKGRVQTMYEKLLMVMGILAALCATGVISIAVLWLIMAGDPLVTLASAPF